MEDWFRQPVRDNDEGYVDINLALNALESAYIQLTGQVVVVTSWWWCIGTAVVL